MADPVGLTDAHIDLSQLTGVEVVSVVGVVARERDIRYIALERSVGTDLVILALS